MFNLKFTPFAIPPIITAIILLFVSTIAFRKSHMPKVKTTFTLFCFSMIFWLFGFILMYLSPNEDAALKWARIGFIGITFIPIFAYHFILSFINSKRRFLLVLLYLSTVPTIILSRTDYIYSGIANYFWGYYPTAGKLYFIPMLIFFGTFTWGVFLLFLELLKSKKNNEPIRTQQIKYVLLAFAFGTTGVIDYIVKYRISIYPYGYLSAIAFISLIAYAIAQYRLMDISLVFRGGLIFFPYFLTIYAGSILIMLFVGYNFWLTIIFLGVILIIAPLFRDYMRSKITGVIDSVIFRGKYKYQNRLLNFIDTMILTTKESDLLQNTLKTLIEAFYIKKIVILTLDNITRHYVNKSKAGLDESVEYTIQNNSYITQWLKRHKEVFVLEEEEKRLPSEEIENIKKELEPLQAKVCVPVQLELDLVGIITLSNKSTGEIYTHIDLEILHRLGTQLAAALDYKRIEAQLRREQELVSIGQLSMEISHEMRNLLQSPRTFLDLSAERRNDDEFFKGFRDMAIERMNVASNKLDDIMYFGRERPADLKSGVDINAILDSNIKANDLSIKKQSIEIIKQYSNIPTVKADSSQLTHLFNNLILNAVDAMTGKVGKLRIRTIENTAVNTEMEARSDKWVRIEVKDDGGGIPKNVMDRLFTPFVTTKSLGNIERKGTGLGLPVVKKVVDMHNGYIHVNTKEGAGTTFVIDLPVDLRPAYITAA